MLTKSMILCHSPKCGALSSYCWRIWLKLLIFNVIILATKLSMSAKSCITIYLRGVWKLLPSTQAGLRWNILCFELNGWFCKSYTRVIFHPLDAYESAILCMYAYIQGVLRFFRNFTYTKVHLECISFELKK